MASSEARIAANRANSARSTGPKTAEGKAASRQNALKHGLSGAGVVLPEADAREVEVRTLAFAEELGAEGEVGEVLARRAALNSVRMERAADQQAAALARRIREVEADFVAPEGVDEAEAGRLRAEAARIAMLDTSKEATLARKYEGAAERAFFRCLKELRERNRPPRVAPAASEPLDLEAIMASFERANARDAEFEARYFEGEVPLPKWPVGTPDRATPGVDSALSVTIGRPG